MKRNVITDKKRLSQHQLTFQKIVPCWWGSLCATFPVCVEFFVAFFGTLGHIQKTARNPFLGYATSSYHRFPLFHFTSFPSAFSFPCFFAVPFLVFLYVKESIKLTKDNVLTSLWAELEQMTWKDQCELPAYETISLHLSRRYVSKCSAQPFASSTRLVISWSCASLSVPNLSSWLAAK